MSNTDRPTGNKTSHTGRPYKVRICPRCGSKKTLPIIWRGPERGYMREDGLFHGGYEVPDPTPRYHCMQCGNDILYKVDDWEEHTRLFEFIIGDYFGRNYVLRLTRAEEGKEGMFELARAYGNGDKAGSSVAGRLSPGGYQKYLHRIFASCLLEWDPVYSDYSVMDGIAWKIRIQYDDDREDAVITGNNAYPPLWNRFMRAVNSLENVPDIDMNEIRKGR